MPNAAFHSPFLIICCTVISLATPVLGGDSQPFTITAVVLEGDDVPDIGAVLEINNVSVNNDGEWIIEAETDHAGDCPNVLLRGGVLLLRQCEPLDEPQGAFIFDFGSVNINNSGSSGWEFDLYSKDAIQGVYLNTDLLLLEGDISTAKDFTPGTTYAWFFGTKINNNDPPQILLNAEVDDPNIPGSDDRALVIITPNADGPGVTETVVFKEGDILPGQTEPIISFANFFTGLYALNDAGDVMFGARIEDPILLRVVYINGLLVAEEGGPSPIEGRNWNHLWVAASVDLNSRGDHVLRGGLDGDPQTSTLIARNDEKLVQRGDVLPGTNGALISMPAIRPVLINDLGQVLWLGRWDNPADDSVLQGLLLDLTFLVREGVPTEEGFVFKSLAPDALQAFAMSDNGRYIIFEADLFDNTNGAFLIDFGAPCPWDLDGSGSVGASDLLSLLASWGPCKGCPADFDENGNVGASDLLALLANWGPCP